MAHARQVTLIEWIGGLFEPDPPPPGGLFDQFFVDVPGVETKPVSVVETSAASAAVITPRNVVWVGVAVLAVVVFSKLSK